MFLLALAAPILLGTFSVPIEQPNALCVHEHILYVTNAGNRGIGTVWAYRDSALVATWNTPESPYAASTDSQGNLYLACYGLTSRVLCYSPSGTLLHEWDVPKQTMELAIDAQDRIYTATLSRVTVFDTQGNFLSYWDVPLHILALALGPQGNIYLWCNNHGDCSVLIYSPNGTLLGTYPQPYFTYDMAVDNAGHIILSFGYDFLCLALNGTIIWDLSPSRIPGEDNFSCGGICVDSGGRIYLADDDHGRIRIYGDQAVPAVKHTWGQLKARFR